MVKQEENLNKQLSEFNKRLGIVISLLLRTIPKNEKSISLKEQVRILDSLGIRPRDIADILGRTPTHISKELAGLHKGKIKRHE
jgi:flagellar basal body P-ring protein FlgI